MRALWIEIRMIPDKPLTPVSRPVRALWIEIMRLRQKYSQRSVEAREGLVD